MNITLYSFYLIRCVYLDNSLTSLSEVGLHVSLKVEEGELIVLLDLKKLSKLGIGVDNATIVLVLKAMLYNVSINLLTNIGSGELSSRLLSEESSELVANASRLYEARGLAVAIALALLSRSLLCNLHLARYSLLESLEITLYSGEKRDELLKLCAELSHSLGNEVNWVLGSNGLRGGSYHLVNNGGRSLGLLGLGSLSSLLGGLCASYHSS
jgi:hypothetical protein